MPENNNLPFGKKFNRDVERTLAPGRERRATRRATNAANAETRRAATPAENFNPTTGVNQGNRAGRRRRSETQSDYFGIARRKMLEAPRQDGATASGQDGVNRRYDAATKTWKIVK